MNKQAPGDGTVGKALEILDMVAERGQPVRFSTLLAESTHPKATLYRLLQTLTNQGMLTYDSDRQTYAPGMRLVKLAHSAWRQSSLAPIARPYIDALAEAVGETVHLAQMDRGQVLYVDKRNASDPLDMFSQAGKVGPGYCTGVGKAMMAFLDPDVLEHALATQAYFSYTANTLSTAEALRDELQEIARTGVSFDREEHEPGIICIAAPILSPRRKPLGALSVTTSTERKSLEDLAELKPIILSTSAEIAEAAETWQFPT